MIQIFKLRTHLRYVRNLTKFAKIKATFHLDSWV